MPIDRSLDARPADGRRSSLRHHSSVATWPMCSRVAGPCSRRSLAVERFVYRVSGSIPRASSAWRATPSRCSRSASLSILAAAPAAAAPGRPATEPDRRRPRADPTRPQHRGQLHHQHQLAELRRRDDDERMSPSSRPGRPELRLGRGRHGRRRGARHVAWFVVAHRRSVTSGPTSPETTLYILLPISPSSPRSFLVWQGFPSDGPVPRTATTVEGTQQNDLPRPRRRAGGDQGARHERWRDRERQLGRSVREPDTASRTSSELFLHPRHPLRALTDHIREC